MSRSRGDAKVVTIKSPDTDGDMAVPKRPASHCVRCGLADHHWPGCPAIGTDDRPVLPGCDEVTR